MLKIQYFLECDIRIDTLYIGRRQIKSLPNENAYAWRASGDLNPGHPA